MSPRIWSVTLSEISRESSDSYIHFQMPHTSETLINAFQATCDEVPVSFCFLPNRFQTDNFCKIQ